MAQLIADDVARNTIIVSWLILVIASVNAVLIAPKAIQIIRSKRERSSNGFGDEWTSLQNISKWRVLLLLVGAIIYVVEAVNTLIYIMTLWRTGSANSVVLQIVRLFTVTPGGPLSTVATTFRFSIILATKPIWRVWLIKGVLGTAVIYIILLESVFIKNIVAYWNYSEEEWQSAVMVPPWIGPMVILLPIWCIGGSLASLKLAFTTPNAVQPKPSKISNQRLNSSGSTLQSTSKSNTSQSNASSQPTAKRYQAVQKGGLSSNQLLQQALNVSFQLLTLIMAICWTVFIVFIVYDNRLLPVKGQAVRTLCACVAFAAESMFEPVFNKSKALARTLQSGATMGQGESQGGGFTVKTLIVG